jgi:hypothetical protein
VSIYIETNYPSTLTGSTDVSCTGLVSSSGNATIIKQNADAANAAASAHKRRRSIIIGISVTLAFLVLFGLSVAIFFWMRRRQRLNREEEASLAPHQFVEVEKTPDQVLSIDSDLNSSPRTGPSGKAALAAVGALQATSSPSQGSTHPPGLSPSDSDPPNTSPTLTITNADSQSSTSGFASFPTTSIRRNRKAAEAGDTTQLPASEHSETALSPVDMAEEEGEILFQHRDAGRAVRELPPPYLDQVGPGRSSPA